MHTTTRLSWIGLSAALGYFSVGWVWKRAFVWGESQGPYWLFVLMDWTVLPLALVSCIGFVLATVWLVRGLRREGLIRSAALTSVGLLLASLSFLGASFPLLLSLLTPLDSLTAQGRVYHLAGIMALADDNYALFECDRYGLLCRQIYRSGDYSLAEPRQTGLAYDVATNTLSVAVGARGTIHTYNPSRARLGREDSAPTR
jgi:hypothetical protein